MGKMSITRKILIVVVTLLGITALGTTSLRASSAIGLRESSIITGETITLGDVFYGLHKDEDKVIGIAPRPGREMTLNARTLLRIAVAMELPWRPTTNGDQIVLRREATVIDRQTIDAALKSSLSNEGVNGNYKVVLAAMPDEITLPMDQPATVEVSSMNYKADRNWFEATLSAPSKDNPIQQIKVSGTVQNMVSIPVLREPLRSGMIIGKNDLDTIEIRQADLGPDTIINPEELIGMTPRRIVVSAQPVKTTEVESPKIVARGDTVTMIFRNGPLTLTTQGKALEPGTKGDAIRVMNTGSNKTIEAIVTASKEVTIDNF